MELNEYMGYNKSQNKEKKINKPALIAVVVAIILLSIFSKGGSTSTKKDNYNTESAAKVYAESFVKDRLKAPSTAKFCSRLLEMEAKNLGGAKWKVTGWVDSQNSFGAMIRSDFYVTLELNEKGASCINCVIKSR